MTEAPFEMANLYPKHTGLPFVVWISVRGGARHDARVKVSGGPKALPGDMATVALRPEPHVVEGSMEPHDFRLLREWISRNHEALIAYWNDDIDTADVLAALVKAE